MNNIFIPLNTSSKEEVILLSNLETDETVVIYDTIGDQSRVGIVKNNVFYPEGDARTNPVLHLLLLMSKNASLPTAIYDSVLQHLEYTRHPVIRRYTTKRVHIEALQRTATNLKSIWEFVQPLIAQNGMLFYNYNPIDADSFDFSGEHLQTVHLQSTRPGEMMPLLIEKFVYKRQRSDGTYEFGILTNDSNTLPLSLVNL